MLIEQLIASFPKRVLPLAPYKHKKILTDPYFIAIINRFKLCCEDKEYSKVTTDHYVKQPARFMDYLASQHITDCEFHPITDPCLY